MARDIGDIIRAVNRVGIENVSLLSRMTRIPKETIRYILKKKFPEFGLNVGLVVGYAKMGLERNFVVLDFEPDAQTYAVQLLDRLAKTSFLTYRGLDLFEPQHVAIFAVPVVLENKFRFFLQTLREEHILRRFRIERLDWTRHLELRSEYCDFRSRRWLINWERVGQQRELPPDPIEPAEPSPRPELDKLDTLIIKELEIDSWRKMVDLSKKLKVNDRTLRYHYGRHVTPLIESHYVRWLPVNQNQLTKVVGLLCEFHNVSRNGLAKVRHLFNNFPFSWYEAGRKDGYYFTYSFVPTEHLVESMKFLGTALRKHGLSWKNFTLDLTSSSSYTIPYENFGDDGGWFFDQGQALNCVVEAKAAIKRVKIGTLSEDRVRSHLQRTQGVRQAGTARSADPPPAARLS